MEYQHGGDIYRNRVDLDYSANINPYGLPAGVKEALWRAVGQCECYPDSESEKLREALSAAHGTLKERIICTNGAAELIFLIVRALKPRHAVLIAPSFLEYEQALKTEGCEIHWYDLQAESEFRLEPVDLIKWLEELAEHPDLIFLCNPNNPTGLALGKAELEPLLSYLESRQIFCVMDECFNDFLEEADLYSVLCSTNTRKNLFVLKAFTKIYAMAGIRLGYGICMDSGLLGRMKEMWQPWSVSSLAQTAGEAALKADGYVEETRKRIAYERIYMKQELETLGFLVFDSMANYLFFKDYFSVGRPFLYEECLKRRVLIRSCQNYRGLDSSYYRICIKKRKENDLLLKIFQEILAERK